MNATIDPIFCSVLIQSKWTHSNTTCYLGQLSRFRLNNNISYHAQRKNKENKQYDDLGKLMKQSSFKLKNLERI